jgi:hypothetical protein
MKKKDASPEILDYYYKIKRSGEYPELNRQVIYILLFNFSPKLFIEKLNSSSDASYRFKCSFFDF